jgi:hypothetical protein
MALNTYPGLTVDGSLGIPIGATSVATLLPGTTVSSDLLVFIVNIGPLPAGIVLGTSGAVATTNGSLTLMPGQSIFLGRGTATYIAAIAHGPLTGQFTMLNVSTGS